MLLNVCSKMVWSSRLCRICAEIGDACYQIFEKASGRDIEMKMKKCFSFMVFGDDYKPNEICNCCYVKLNEFCDYIELCRASNIKFETVMHPSNQEMWLEKEAGNFNHPEINGVIVNTKNTVENELNPTDVIMVVDYQNPLNLEQTSVNDLNLDVNYVGTDLNKQKETNYHYYDNNQTVLRHSSDFYKTEVNKNVMFAKLRQCCNDIENFNEQPSNNEVNQQIKNENQNEEKSISKKSVQKRKNKMFICQYCEKTFMRKVNLDAHLAIHTHLRPFSCETCQKTFAIQRELTRHIRLHTGIYQCKYCLKNFCVPSKLNRHLRIHTKEKPYVCDVEGCRKSFSDKGNLEGHKVTHSSSRNFTCDICNKSYKTGSQLKDHKKLHVEDTPHKCDICSKSYKWKTNLRVHMKKHLGYTCSNCKKDCVKLSLFFKHRKSCKIKKE